MNGADSVWHMKLSRWGFVVQGCVDGFDQPCNYLPNLCNMQQCCTYIKFFCVTLWPAVTTRSDVGLENALVSRLASREEARQSHCWTN